MSIESYHFKSTYDWEKFSELLITAAVVKVFSRLGRMFCSEASLIQALCRIFTVMSIVPNVKDRGNSCVVMDKRLLVTRHVGDSVSMAT